ncbi:MAG: hypothetical protein QME96_00435 [Myxococcota bacterium]|nr:hypothetical protein [Myxococcota bacterium]
MLDAAPPSRIVLDGIRRVCAPTKRWNYLVDAYKKTVEKLGEARRSERALVLFELAETYRTDMGQKPSALAPLQQAYQADPANVEAIDRLLAIYEELNRPADHVKLLAAKADALRDPADKVGVLLKVADLYQNKFRNVGEAIKAFQKALEVDPANPAAVGALKAIYEARKDWEGYATLARREIEATDDPADRLERTRALAALATERIRKPQLCIELWEQVRSYDPVDPEAVTALAGLYERNKEWEKLADVLRVQADSTADATVRKQVLLKLGPLYGDKIADDGSSISVWRTLMDLDPSDRRAPEQIKKRYLALRAWDGIEAFYAETGGKWDELVRLLEKEASGPDLPAPDKVNVHGKIARLWLDNLSKPDRAAAAYEGILKIVPDHREAVQALVRLYERLGNAAALARVLEIDLRYIEDPADRHAAMARIGTIAAGPLKNPSVAFDWFTRALQSDPSRTELYDALEEAAVGARRLDDLVSAYRGMLAGGAPVDASEIRRRAARVLDESLGRPEEALGEWERVLADDPTNPDALAAIERIYTQMGRYQELLDILEKRRAVAASAEEENGILVRIARVWEEALDNRDRAIDVYREVLDARGDDQEILRVLERLYEAAGRWRDLLGIVERQRDLLDPGSEGYRDRVFRIGRVSQENLADAGRAVECYRSILEDDPSHQGAVDALERILPEPAHRAEAARILDSIYARREDWENLIRAAEALAGTAESVEDRVGHLVRIAEIQARRLARPEQALATYERAFRAAPQDERLLAEIDQLVAALDAWASLARLVAEVVEGVEDRDVRLRLWLKVASIRETYLGDSAAAVEAYVQALHAEPASVEALDALERLYEAAEKHDELLDVYRRKASLEQDTVRKEHYCAQMAFIYDEILGKPDDAIACHRDILALDPANLKALRALEGLYGRLERWNDLADVYQQLLDQAAGADESVRLQLALAEVRCAHMGEVDAAIDLYRDILVKDPRRSEAVVAIERILVSREHEWSVARILEPVYRELGEWSKMVGVLDVLVRHADGARDRVELLQQIGQIEELQGDSPERSLVAYVRAFREDPADDAVMGHVERLARIVGAPERLVEAIEGLVDRVEDRDLAVGLHVRAAEAAEREVGDVERAVRHYRAILGKDPANVDALGSLERIYAGAERYEDLAQVFLRKAEILRDPAEVREQFLQAGRIYEEILDRRDSAIGVYRMLLDRDGEDVTAVDKLIELYIRKQAWEDLLPMYDRKSDLIQDVDERKRILLEMGAVFRHEVGNRAKAIDTYKRIIEMDPSDLQAIAQLDELYEETGSWHDLLHIIEREADLATDPNEMQAFRFRIGRIWEQKLADVPRAIECYRGVLDADPGHQPGIEALERLMTSGREALAAAAVLAPIHEGACEWRKLAATLEVQVANSDDKWQRVEMLHRIADLYEQPTHINEPGAAFDVHARAFRLDPAGDRSIDALERLAMMLDVWPRLAVLYDEGIAAAEPEIKVALGLRAARVFEREIGSTDEAIRRLVAVLEVDGSNAAALEALDRLYRAASRWADLVGVLRREEVIAQDEGEALAFKFDRGQVLQQELGDPAEAILAYREILEIDPQHAATRASLEFLFAEGSHRADIAAILEPIYRAGEEWEKLAGLLEHKVDLFTEPARKIEAIHRVAEIHESMLMSPDDAFRWLGRGLAVVPGDERTIAELDRLAGMLMQGWNDLAGIYAGILTGGSDVPTRLRAGKKLAWIGEEQIGDSDRARQVWEHLLEVDGRDADVLVALDRFYQAAMHWEGLSDILRRRVEVEASAEEQVELLYRLGAVHLDELGDAAGAERAFRRIVDDLRVRHLPALDGLERIYGQAGEWTKLYEVYEAQAGAVLGEAAQSDVYAKMALLAAEALGRPEDAVSLWTRVIEIRGEEPEPLRSLARLYRDLGRWQQLAETLDRSFHVTDGDDARIEILLDMGEIRHQRLDRRQDALDAYQQVFYIDPNHVEALRRTARIHAEAESWEDLIETLDRLVAAGSEVLDPADLREVHAEAGRVYAEKLDRPFDAVEAWRKALALDPGDRRAVDALEMLLKSQERWEEVVEILARKAEFMESAEERISVNREIADTWRDRIGERDRGAEALEAILAAAPHDDAVFAELEEIYTAHERWDDLIAVYARRYEFLAGRPAERAVVLARIGRVYLDKKDDRESAYAVYKNAFLEDFANREIAAELEKVAAATTMWEDLLGAVGAKIAEIGATREAVPLYLAAGRWYAGQLKRVDYAVRTYATVLGQIDPNNVDALLALADVYRDSKQWPALVQTLNRCIEVVDAPERKKEILVQLGSTQEEILGDEREAMISYRAALEIDQRHPGALEALERLYRKGERWDDLVPILERRIAGEAGGERSVGMKLSLAEVFEDRLVRAGSAIKVYREVLDAAPGNERALKGLERLYAREERWQDLLDVLEMQLDVAESERERLTILGRMAGMLEQEFLRHEDAAARLEQILDIDSANENALVGLERIYRHLQRWNDLAETYARHVDVAIDRNEQIAHLKSRSRVFLDHLSDLDRAVDSLRRVLDINPADAEALDEIAKLLERSGDHAGALDGLERLVEVVAEPDRRVDILTRLGTVLEKQMGDRAGAVGRFEQALAIRPDHLPAMAALREIHVDNAEWVPAVRMLDREQAATPGERQRAKLLTQRGRILLDQMGDEAEAVACFEQAVALDPEAEEAGEPLVGIYVRDKQYAKAEPLLDMLLRRFHGKRTAQEMKPLHVALAEAAEALDNTDKALKSLRIAYQTDASSLGTVRSIAALHYKRKEWDNAFKFYQMILVQHIGSQSPQEKVDIYHRLGNIKIAVKEVRKALNMYEKALDVDPLHRPTLDALVSLFEGQRDWEQVIHFKKQIAETVEGDELTALHDGIGDIWREKLNNSHKAIQAYGDALAVKPDDRNVMVKLLKLFHETKQWQKAIEVCSRIISLETEPKRISAYQQLIATTYRDEIKDADKAIEHFDLALDADPENLKNFEAIERIVTPKRDWKGLERAYRRMIKRLPDAGTAMLKENLLHNLGEVARSRLKNYELAAECFRLASEINPDNKVRHEILAELYVMIPQRWEDAVREHQYLIRNDPKRIESYRSLRRIYHDAGRADETWCMCSALCFLGKAQENEQQFFEQYRLKSAPAIRGTISSESWYKHLYHSEQNVYVAKIFEAIMPAVRRNIVQNPKVWGLRKKDLQDPATSNIALAKTLRDASAGLGIPLPDLYVIQDQPGGLQYAFTDPPASLAGQDFLTGYSPMELRFAAARHLTAYRRDHYLQYLLVDTARQMQTSLTEALRVYLYAGVKLGAPDAPVPANDAVNQIVQYLVANMLPQDRDTLRAAARRFVESPTKSVKSWMLAADLTSDRAGLLLCGDLTTAAKVMTRMPPLAADLNPTQRVTELVVFAVSEDYFHLRKEMGVAIGAG